MPSRCSWSAAISISFEWICSWSSVSASVARSISAVKAASCSESFWCNDWISASCSSFFVLILAISWSLESICCCKFSSAVIRAASSASIFFCNCFSAAKARSISAANSSESFNRAKSTSVVVPSVVVTVNLSWSGTETIVFTFLSTCAWSLSS